MLNQMYINIILVPLFQNPCAKTIYNFFFWLWSETKRTLYMFYTLWVRVDIHFIVIVELLISSLAARSLASPGKQTKIS